MPCNIGYKSIVRAQISVPQPKKLVSKTKAPAVDADLLKKIGEEGDPVFVEWLNELDTGPLIEEALKRALSNVDNSNLVKFSIDSLGYLKAEAEYIGDAKKAKTESIIFSVFNQFQFEVLKIVLELLDYNVTISKEGEDNFSLEGEKAEESKVHKYVKITKDSDKDATLRFEHFESPESLEREKAKFLSLSQKLGVKINVFESQDSGQPIPDGTIHRHFFKEGESQ